jgi:peptidase E
MIRQGLPAGYAADDGAALHFIGKRLHQCIASRPKAKCYRVEKKGNEVLERELEMTPLGGA